MSVASMSRHANFPVSEYLKLKSLCVDKVVFHCHMCGRPTLETGNLRRKKVLLLAVCISTERLN